MKKLPQLLIAIGTIFIGLSFLLFIYIFYPVAKVEVQYQTSKHLTISQITPKDKKFGIVIPKINANASIIQEVDPFDPKIYQYALTKGVAQARGTSFPNEEGNMFLFSHSSANLLEARTYNSIFYLLSKLNKNDEIYIYYKNVRYKYVVTDTKIVGANAVSYLSSRSDGKTLTLMTCWPAGTNYKRLLVIAKQVK